MQMDKTGKNNFRLIVKSENLPFSPVPVSKSTWHTAFSRERKWVEMDFLSGCGSWERSTEYNRMLSSHPDYSTCASSTQDTRRSSDWGPTDLSQNCFLLYTQCWLMFSWLYFDALCPTWICFHMSENVYMLCSLDECNVTHHGRFPMVWSYCHCCCHVFYLNLYLPCGFVVRCRSLA